MALWKILFVRTSSFAKFVPVRWPGVCRRTALLPAAQPSPSWVVWRALERRRQRVEITGVVGPASCWVTSGSWDRPLGDGNAASAYLSPLCMFFGPPSLRLRLRSAADATTDRQITLRRTNTRLIGLSFKFRLHSPSPPISLKKWLFSRRNIWEEAGGCTGAYPWMRWATKKCLREWRLKKKNLVRPCCAALTSFALP